MGKYRGGMRNRTHSEGRPSKVLLKEVTEGAM